MWFLIFHFDSLRNLLDPLKLVVVWEGRRRGSGRDEVLLKGMPMEGEPSTGHRCRRTVLLFRNAAINHSHQLCHRKEKFRSERNPPKTVSIVRSITQCLNRSPKRIANRMSSHLLINALNRHPSLADALSGERKATRKKSALAPTSSSSS